MNPRALLPRLNAMQAVYVFLAVGTPLLGTGCLERELKPLNPCLVSGVVAEIAVTNVDKIDMLFMVDNSGSMREEQGALRAQFPNLIRVLTSGDKDGDGNQDFPPAKNLHIGVVSSDLGLSGIAGIQDCENLGDDGILQNVADPAMAGVTGCSAQTYMPRFLSYQEMVDDPAQLAADFGCIASLGTTGCGFEQQLESTLKAVWPGSDMRINFLPDPNGFGTQGQAGPNFPNGDFIRNDPNTGLSLIAIILVTDEEDCSSSNTGHFRPIDPTVPMDSPLRSQGLNTRCYFENQRPEPNNVYDISRYVNGFKALREGNEKLVIFGGIVGVPVNLVTPERINAVDFLNPAASDAFYDGLLADPAMIETLDDRGTPEIDDDNLVPSCNVEGVGKAYPPRRIVEVAKGFGANGVIQSICQADFTEAMQAIIDVIAKQLGAVCLPRPLVRNSEGLVGCNVVWELPVLGTAPESTPTTCGAPGFEFLLPPDPGRETTSNGRNVCKVAQLAVVSDGTTKNYQPTDNGGTVYDNGWYYDEFSDAVMIECTGAQKQRVAFTPAAKPPTGVTVKLECLNETQSLADNRTNLLGDVDQPAIGDPCDDVRLRGQEHVSGDPACVVLLADRSEDASLFCHQELNVCVLGCASDADCPAAWVCDSRPESMQAASDANDGAGRAYCVNPTCGGENK